jgi:hypothetical protein
MELAKEIGGIAKTASADRGDLGVALFATPEAASLFARACQPPLVPLRVELDSSGVRCLLLPQAGESAAVYTPAPETGVSSISAEAVVRSLVEDKTTEKTLGQQGSDVLPTSHRVVPETQASALASEPIIIEEAPAPPSGSAVIVEALAPATEPAAEESAMQNGPAARPPRHRRWIAPAVGGVLIVGTLFAVWLTKTLDNHKAPPAAIQHRAAPTMPESPPSTENELVPTSGGMVAPPVAPPGDPASPPSAAQRSRGSTASASSGKPLPAAQPTPSGRPRARAGRGDPANPSLLRAGKLSTDDF